MCACVCEVCDVRCGMCVTHDMMCDVSVNASEFMCDVMCEVRCAMCGVMCDA